MRTHIYVYKIHIPNFNLNKNKNKNNDHGSTTICSETTLANDKAKLKSIQPHNSD